MSLDPRADEMLRATKKALAETEAKLKAAHAQLVRRDADDAIMRSGATSPDLLALNMAASGRVASNGRDVEYSRGGRWLDRDAYVSEMKRDPETARFFAGAIPRKAAPTTSDNPFSRKSFNLTRQFELIRKDPDEAMRLRLEAD